MHLKVLGFNYKTAPIDIRERFSIGKHSLRRGLEHLDDYDGLNEVVILSTCNRTEFYAVTSDACEDSVKQFANDIIGGGVDEYLYQYEGEDCIRHLFEVAASLDSLILGEGQILSQVKEAYSIAKSVGATSAVLNTLFHKAIASGKTVRSETRIAYNSVSVSSAAVALADEKLGGLENKSALIFGAGKMAMLTAQHLKSHGVKKIFVANHHLERALDMATQIGGTAIPWEDAMQHASEVDVIITSTGAPHYVVKSWQTQQLMARRNGRGIFIVDIAVPRDVDPAVGKIKGVTLYNIDDLEAVVESHVKERQEEAKHAKVIIDADVAAMVDKLKYLKFRPLMANLSERAEKIRERELRRVSGKLPNLTEDERRAVDNMTRMIVRKLLRLPMMNLNASARANEGEIYAEAMRTLFSE